VFLACANARKAGGNAEMRVPRSWRDRSDRCPAAVFRKKIPQNKILQT
jgi:hypothetical protein